MTGFSKDGFNHQIDVVVTNCDTSFTDIKANLIGNHKFYLLTRVTLDKLVSRHFIDYFFTKGNLCMLSYNTRLDCHDCVCLLSNSNLILNVEQSTYEKLPRKLSKKTSKSTGFTKYEVNIMLNELAENDEANLIRSVFKRYSYSFYVSWLPNDARVDAELDLRNFFGADCVTPCMNRVESKTFQLSSDLIEFCDEFNLSQFDNWLKFENLIGCLTNDIKPEFFFNWNESTNGNSSSSKTNTISVLRVKGFMPNNYLNQIINQFLNGLFEMSESNKRIFIKLHGFYDSPVSLINLGPSQLAKIRVNEENFFSVCFEKNTYRKNVTTTNESKPMHTCLFKDYNKCYLINI